MQGGGGSREQGTLKLDLKGQPECGWEKTAEEGNARQREQPVLRHRGRRDVPRESQVVPCGISRELQVVSNLR